MELAIFDLDNTLLGGDSDYLWGRFLGENGYVDQDLHEKRNKAFYEDYQKGCLDIHAFAKFQFQPLATNTMQTLQGWRQRFIDEKIRPIVLPKALELVKFHRNKRHELLIITATNRFISAPIAELFGITHLIATELEMRCGAYTGKLSGVPAFAENKVIRLQAWLKERGQHINSSWFYSDSHNDLALLEHVTYPIAVDPDEILRHEAKKHDWQVISLR